MNDFMKKCQKVSSNVYQKTKSVASSVITNTVQVSKSATSEVYEATSEIDNPRSYCLDGYGLMKKLMGGISDMELAGYCWNKLYRKSAIEPLLFRQYVPVEDFDLYFFSVSSILLIFS